ncbi:hypothetical protein OEA41_007440 [Lepraria neglecta]|uniref:Uncharacterized protein n=1 Tax=Lepraria neglecta TaxID=209136 RepID=A0AAD9ZCS1_9LECA|nr:hypothetical protein OEA41_007440 [Lepraria neglecta]
MAQFQRQYEKKTSDPLEDIHDFEHRGHARYVSLGSSHASENDMELSPSLAGKESNAAPEEPQGIWFFTAAIKPHYGQIIRPNGPLPLYTASWLVAAFAKSIELTFVTVSVAFLGQMLSRRAFKSKSNGITIADMQIRAWVLQPGTLFTSIATVRYAALTLLGAAALTAAILAMLYTTASDALDVLGNRELWSIVRIWLFHADSDHVTSVKGLGEYYLQASVPSPSVNVLCANMTKDELAPIVITEWPQYVGLPFNGSNETLRVPSFPSWINSTAVDDLFGFGEKYNRTPPVFAKFPEPYNTITNFTSFPLYHETMIGGFLTSNCEDPDDELAYSRSHPDATSGVTNQNWRDVAAQWAVSTSLNGGVSDDDASNARLLTQLIPTELSLNPSLPSIAEGLAVLAGSTLLLSSIDSPFIHYWQYNNSTSVLDPPTYESFQATLRTHDYSSGGTQHGQEVFYPVLALVFLANLFCLVYFLTRRSLVTDFVDPKNLLALALNSSPSRVLEGACGGLEDEQLKTTWQIRENQQQHFYIQPSTPRTVGMGLDGGFEMEERPQV